ncbi:hypothetical protein H2203_007886 [Taxawa tesnikishii (nom. ined.)]|nr:hypothetical protein H2203_007886 [Dothideales sp. JES 119]
MSVSDVNFYAAWEPVRINAGLGDGQFFINETGLQWGSETAFGGWLVCDWWHGVPQLFAKWGYYHYDNPSSCADVQLRPVYL